MMLTLFMYVNGTVLLNGPLSLALTKIFNILVNDLYSFKKKIKPDFHFNTGTLQAITTKMNAFVTDYKMILSGFESSVCINDNNDNVQMLQMLASG